MSENSGGIIFIEYHVNDLEESGSVTVEHYLVAGAEIETINREMNTITIKCYLELDCDKFTINEIIVPEINVAFENGTSFELVDWSWE